MLFAQDVTCAELPAGRIVWWGKDFFWQGSPSDHTNGVIEINNQILSNVVAIAAGQNHGLALKTDGTVVAFGFNYFGNRDVPAGLNNVASVAIDGRSCWAIKHDGTATRWGGEEGENNVVASLSNVTGVAWGGYKGYLALRNDGTVLGFRLDPSPDSSGPPHSPDFNPVQIVRAHGQVLSNVVALASIGDSPIVLKRDGTVLELGFQTPGSPSSRPQYRYRTVNEDGLMVYTSGEVWNVPYQYTTADPVTENGTPLSNVIAVAGSSGHALALKRDGTVVAWGRNISGETIVPANLSNVTAIAADDQLSLALKRDGTVAAWGYNAFGQTSVPPGLSNVVAIAAGGWFSLALTTGTVPSSVFIQPHGRLEEMAQECDVVFKGQAISSTPSTNAALRISQMDVHATKFKLISVLKGDVFADTVVFQHYTKGPGFWGGPSPPPYYQFEPGQSYIVFAADLDRSDRYYSPSPGTARKAEDLRQFAGFPHSHDDGATRTLDDRPLGNLPVKAAHWFELNRLLNDANPSNQLYAIRHLDSLSANCATSREHTEDFSREQVLNAIAPFLTNANDEVAVAALACFRFGLDCIGQIAPYADTLIQIATHSASAPRRGAAVAAFARTRVQTITNSLPQWLSDPAEDVRVEAVRLLLDFSGEFADRALAERADDPSPKVRAVVADVIGQGKFPGALPALVKLFADPVGKDPLIPPLTMEMLRAGQRWNNVGDVHTSAGLALVQFEPDQVAEILKTNLNDPGFHVSFVAKLAEKDAGPWLPELRTILETRRKYVEEISRLEPTDPKRFYDPAGGNKVLVGAYAKCWEDIRQYLLHVPAQNLSDSAASSYMDLLEKTAPQSSSGGGTIYEACHLYELYRTRRLDERANAIRRAYTGEKWWFDDFDENHPELKTTRRR